METDERQPVSAGCTVFRVSSTDENSVDFLLQFRRILTVVPRVQRQVLYWKQQAASVTVSV